MRPNNWAFMLFRKTISLLLETLFPRFCIKCGLEGRYICDWCLLFASESEQICCSCQEASFNGSRHKECRETLDGLISLWDYDGVIKKAMKEVKEEGRHSLLQELIENALLLFERDEQRFKDFLNFLIDEETVISFVPSHSFKKRERGFDVSEKLADYLCKGLGKKREVLLKRERRTEPQEGLNRENRFLNVSGAFSFVGAKREKVVLVSDLWISGATMKESSRLLKENGVVEVWGFVVAKIS